VWYRTVVLHRPLREPAERSPELRDLRQEMWQRDVLQWRSVRDAPLPDHLWRRGDLLRIHVLCDRAALL
jgi:hypothetical protein